MGKFILEMCAIWLRSLMVTISTLPELKGALVTRCPIWPNLFSLTFTTVSGTHWHCRRKCSCLSTGEEQRACFAGILWGSLNWTLKSFWRPGCQAKNSLPDFTWSTYRFGWISLFSRSPRYPSLLTCNAGRPVSQASDTQERSVSISSIKSAHFLKPAWS